MKILVDTNIVLDSWLEREPFAEDAKALLQAIESGEIEGCLAATTVTDIFYISRKSKGAIDTKKYISRLLTFMQICKVDLAILQAAVASELSDLEDAVQLACALAYDVDAIVTRNFAGFVDSPVPIKSAGEVLAEPS